MDERREGEGDRALFREESIGLVGAGFEEVDEEGVRGCCSLVEDRLFEDVSPAAGAE